MGQQHDVDLLLEFLAALQLDELALLARHGLDAALELTHLRGYLRAGELDAVAQALDGQHHALMGTAYLSFHDGARRVVALGGLEQAQNCSFQRSSLVVTMIKDEAAVQLVEGIVIAALRRADAGSFEIAGIGPRFIPCRFPE